MAHFRSTLIDRVVTAISGNGVTVEKSRIFPTDTNDLPRYVVYATDEETDWSMGVGSAHRRLEMMIEVVLDGASSTLQDTLNGHCQYIEDQLNSAGSIADTLWTRVTSTNLEYDDTGQVAFGIAKLTVDVGYVTLTADASTSA